LSLFFPEAVVKHPVNLADSGSGSGFSSKLNAFSSYFNFSGFTFNSFPLLEAVLYPTKACTSEDPYFLKKSSYLLFSISVFVSSFFESSSSPRNYL